MRTLRMNARDVLSSFNPIPSVSGQPITLVFTSQPFPSEVPVSSLTPTMDRVRFVTLSTGIMTFTGSLNFLRT